MWSWAQAGYNFTRRRTLHCPMNGVFVIAKDELIAYAQTKDGWS
jgi:hypothetical protein